MSGAVNHGPGLDHRIGDQCPINDPACVAELERGEPVTTHVLTSEGRNHYGPAWPHKLDIVGGDAISYGIFTVPAGESARRQTGGPEVPGPWADVWGHATVIDGTRHEPGLRVQPGDILILDGERYTVALSDGIGAKGTRGWVRRGYPILIHEDEV